MKIKIFALILSLVIVSLSIIACVEIPLGPSESMGENSGSQVVGGSAGVSEPAESSKDEPPVSYEDSSEEPSTDQSSEEPSSERAMSARISAEIMRFVIFIKFSPV